MAEPIDEDREFRFRVTVKAGTRAQAEEVMSRRILHDADYGFPYEVSIDGTTNEPGRGE